MTQRTRFGTIFIDANFAKAPTTLRPISFLFYTLETIFNMFCMAFHIRGFMAVDMHMLTWDRHAFHYFYLCTFYVFMVITLFQSINICSGHSPTINMEIFKSCFASSVFITISLLTMFDAERDFHLMNTGKEPKEGVYEEDKPMHPFDSFLRLQSVCSLGCGILYMLHAVILIDIKITASYLKSTKGIDTAFVPINVYILSEYVQSKLERYEWFRNFCSNDRIDI